MTFDRGAAKQHEVGSSLAGDRRLRRILFVSRDYASDFSGQVSGMSQRMRMLLDGAAESAATLDILFLADQRVIDEIGPGPAQRSLEVNWGIAAQVYLAPRAPMRHGALIQTLLAAIDFRAQENYFRLNGPEQRAAVRSHVRPDTDLIVAHRLNTGSTVVGARIEGVPIVMDLDDVEHRKLARQIARPSDGSRLARLEVQALKRGELALLRACQMNFVCSRVDQEYLASEGVSNTTVVPNAMSFDDDDAPAESTSGDRKGPPTLLFIGTYGYYPNVDAAEHLINAVFPLVLNGRPDALLLIVGASVENIPSYARRPARVEFAGFVPDLDDVYRRATVVCCTILIGGGTRIKIIEAAARRKAIVSTTVGAEGLLFTNDVEILLRDTPQAFADACIALLNNPGRTGALGAAAYEKARSLYERRRSVGIVAGAFRRAAGDAPA